MTEKQQAVLEYLKLNPGWHTPTDIAEHFGITRDKGSQWAYPSLKALVKAGDVTRDAGKYKFNNFKKHTHGEK
ncbi:MarR family transcriptional regulator [Chitinophaga nivalis]|uniref:MarR family transcriptional regulator n=1 Tax=Chitinophaga nivalis TaxID=2991709 RepID=A0ABT3IIH9_9BACT|nr:MarR family transcriptional regulator [Chitinophaga nivalis]MCW3466537.1 MarR family transcriptional regulator [Chitinophaga nivalis]MCW3483772.1 MarR family transcriptional regulator [Chitinophaga nivalis]